jgi:hypothetical protein
MVIGGTENLGNTTENITCTVPLVLSWCLSLLLRHLLAICHVLLLDLWSSSSHSLVCHTCVPSQGSKSEVVSCLASRRFIPSSVDLQRRMKKACHGCSKVD